jgi:hypothetical protein
MLNAIHFEKPPLYLFFLKRLGMTTFIWALLVWGLTGLYYKSPVPMSRTSRFMDSADLSKFPFNPDGLIQLWDDTLLAIHSPPGICESSETLRDIEKNLCLDFRNRLNHLKWIAVTPWIPLLLFLSGNWVFYSVFYLRLERQLSSTPPRQRGIILKNKRRTSFFEKFFLLRPIEVELPNKNVTNAYLGQEFYKAKTGQDVLLYEIIPVLGDRYYIAFLDYPHISILKSK